MLKSNSKKAVENIRACRIPAVKGLYTQLYGYWYHAGNVTYLRGRNREIASLRIGYKF